MSQQLFIPPSIRDDRDPSLIRPRPYQEEALAAIEAAWDRGVRRPLVQLPTGMGKTVLFSMLARKRLPAMAIAHRDELLDQAIEKYRMVDPTASTGKIAGSSNAIYAEFVAASIQTLFRDNRLAQIPRGYFKVVIVDEAHHATADSYRKVIDHLDDGNTLILGVTATPERGGGGGLEGVWHEMVYSYDLLRGIEEGYLADIRGVQVRLKNAEFGRVGVSKFGDFKDGESAKMLSDAGAPSYAVTAYLEHALPESGDRTKGRKTILFTPTVQLAYEFAAAFNAEGIPAEAVDGKIGSEDRVGAVRRLRSGETRVLCNCALFTEGFDEPSVECIVVARPTLSRVLYIQMIGRGTRIHPGKTDCLVIDLVGATERLNLVTVPNLFGVSSDELEDLGLVAAVQAKKPKTSLTAGPTAVEGLETESTRVDLFTNRRFNWLRSVAGGVERYVLSLGEKGYVVMTLADGDLWDVAHEQRDATQTPLAHGLDLGYAQGAAEDYVRKQGAAWLNNPKAPWRQKPASDKQIGALLKWKVPLIVEGDDGRRRALWNGEPLTAGIASDLLSEKAAAAQGRKAAKRSAA